MNPGKQKNKPANTVLTYEDADGVERNLSLKATREILDAWRLLYQDGDGSALVSALSISLESGGRLPEWVRAGLIDSIAEVRTGKQSSWDQVFGSAKHLRRWNRRYSFAHRVLEHVAARKEGVAIDDSLFESIGKRLYCSTAKAKQYYYEFFGASKRPRKTSKK